jgi:primosomal protein N'
MKYKSINKPEKCPDCGSEKIARILYGLPSFSESLRKRIENNEIVLGGCCITGNDPS